MRRNLAADGLQLDAGPLARAEPVAALAGARDAEGLAEVAARGGPRRAELAPLLSEAGLDRHLATLAGGAHAAPDLDLARPGAPDEERKPVRAVDARLRLAVRKADPALE